MPDTRLLVEIDGAELAAGGDLGGCSSQVVVEEALDEADAATLVARLEAGGDGEWTSVLDPLLEPLTPLVVQVVARRGRATASTASRPRPTWRIDAGGALAS